MIELLELIGFSDQFIFTAYELSEWYFSQSTQVQIFVISPLIAAILYLLPSSRPKYKQHKKNIRIAKKTLIRIKKLSKKNDHDEIFKLLRTKISPYVFEELVLTSFGQYGAKITRSPSYSGDGGIDGKVKIKGQTYLIQSKKYSGYIKASDTRNHISLCKSKGTRGYFVHTGLSGKMSKQAAHDSPVSIISDADLINLFTGRFNF